MKYYYLDVDLDKKNGSCLIYRTSNQPEVHDDKGVYAFGRIDFPEISEIKYLLLISGGVLNDILSAEMLRLTGLLINEKAKGVFSSFNLPPSKYYLAYVKDSKEYIYEYWWLQTSLKRDFDNFLNYQKSSFYWKKDIIGVNKEDIEINTLKDIAKFRKNLKPGQAIKLKKAVLKKEFADLNIDLFKIGRLSTDWIISNRLKIALENAKITGVSFKEADNIVVKE